MESMGPVLAGSGTRPHSPSVLRRCFLPECLSGWGIGSHLVNPAQFVKSLQVFDRHVIKLEEFARSRFVVLPFWLRLFVEAREARSGPPSELTETRLERLAKDDIDIVNVSFSRQVASSAARLLYAQGTTAGPPGGRSESPSSPHAGHSSCPGRAVFASLGLMPCIFG